jgi:hypothetical protein
LAPDTEAFGSEVCVTLLMSRSVGGVELGLVWQYLVIGDDLAEHPDRPEAVVVLGLDDGGRDLHLLRGRNEGVSEVGVRP